MKGLIWTYLIGALFVLAILSVLSYGFGAGYVYVYWRDWQVQTTVWASIFVIAILGFVLQLLWISVKRYLSREQRKLETVFDFKNLHPYEQLGVIWLLDAAQDQHAFIDRIFTQSGLLKGIVESKLLSRQGHYTQALNALNHTAPMAFELAELQRIEIFLALHDTEKALTHLEFLQQHQLSPWLKDIEQSYRQKITEYWGRLALQQSWLYLRSLQYGHLDAHTRDLWLQQVLTQFEDASVDDLYALQQRYLELEQEIQTRPYSSKVLWLKLLSRMPEMSIQHERLALHLLREQFDRDVFYLWFQQQLLKQAPDYADIETKIEEMEQTYLSQPILSFAKWYVYEATERHAQADALLTLYPDNVLMSYLRIKAKIKDNDELVQQLNLIFENDANFIQFKI